VPERALWAPIASQRLRLSPALTDSSAPVRQGLRDAGFIEGQNMAIEFRWAETDFDRLPALAADLVRHPVNMILAIGAASAVAAKGATTRIPVVFYMGEDPVSLGVVPSFNRPGGNLTGVATLSSEVMAKRLELLREIAPRAEAFAALINPKNPSAEISTKEVKTRRDGSARISRSCTPARPRRSTRRLQHLPGLEPRRC
jgi:putative ABC transport system substrate-binding protein